MHVVDPAAGKRWRAERNMYLSWLTFVMWLFLDRMVLLRNEVMELEAKLAQQTKLAKVQ